MAGADDDDSPYVETIGSSDWARRLDGVSGTPYWRHDSALGGPWSLPRKGRRGTRVVVTVVALVVLLVVAVGQLGVLF